MVRRPAPAGLAATRPATAGARAAAAPATRPAPAAATRPPAAARPAPAPAPATRAAATRAAATRAAATRVAVQLALPFKRTGRGGARKNAGRKPGPHPKTPHRARPRHYFGHPVHVTLRAALGSLRSQLLYPTVRIAISRATRHAPERFRIVHFSVQSNHLHLIVEAAERRALTAGVHGLEIRITRYINRLLMRRGALWADRWHGRALKSPREVRHALVYVLANFRKHSLRPVQPGADPRSSGAWFHGWRGMYAQRGPPPLAGRALPLGKEDEKVPVSEPRTWLLREGFLKAGRVRLDEAPRPERARNRQRPPTARG